MNFEASWVSTLMTGGLSAMMAFAAFWTTLGGRITTSSSLAQSAEEKADAATRAISLLNQELNNMRVDTSGRMSALEQRTLNTALALQQTEERLARAVDSVGKKVDHLGEKIVQALTDYSSRPTRSHQ